MIVGFEAANSFVKLKTRSGEVIYPNTVREIFWNEEMTDIIQNAGAVDRRIYEYEGKKYVVGEDGLSSSSRDVDRYRSPQFKRESLFAIARHARNGDKIVAVTGVPASHYYDDSAKQDIIDALTGSHKICVNGADTTFDIINVHVILQPLGTLTYLVIDDEGYVKDKSLMNGSKVVIDIGWGTVDCAVMSKMSLNDSVPVDIAMRDAYQKIESGLKAKFPELKSKTISLFELEKQLRIGTDFIRFGGTWDAESIKRKAFEDTANEIMARIKNRITLSDYDAVIFTGGGVDALAPYLKQHLEGMNAKRVADAQLANVRGFYTYGKVKNNA